MEKRSKVTAENFHGRVPLAEEMGNVEWAIAWPEYGDGSTRSYCNTVPTPHGLAPTKPACARRCSKASRPYGELIGNKKAAQITGEDIFVAACSLISVFIKNPQFQGQTKDKLTTPEAARLVEQAGTRPFLSLAVRRSRIWPMICSPGPWNGSRNVCAASRKKIPSARPPQTSASCVYPASWPIAAIAAPKAPKSISWRAIPRAAPPSRPGTARHRRSCRSAVKSSTWPAPPRDKIRANQEISDIIQALGCGSGDKYDEDDLRYEKIVIMTDADVDGAHIATLLMTYFYQEMPDLIKNGHLYLAQPPLYRIAQGGKVLYARDDAHKDELMASEFTGRGKVEVSRFKGLGEMPPAQLRETTMTRGKRTLLRIVIPKAGDWRLRKRSSI